MKDRISQNPGRVLVKPENGNAQFYATLVRADNPIQEGDALNKANLLTDATAALLGLGENAVPDDAFAQFGMHWWKRRTEESGYAVVETPNTTITTYAGWELGNTATFYYSSSYTMTSGGKFVLNSPTQISIKHSYPQSWGALTGAAVGKYVATSNGECEYLIYNVSGNVSNSSGVVFTNQTKITSKYYENIGEYEYVSSTNRNAYPDGGTLSGFTYTYLAVPFENARDSAKIVTGSYVGTNVYGSANPCSLTFDFAPKLVWIYGLRSNAGLIYDNASPDYNIATCIPMEVLTTTYTAQLPPWAGSSGNAYSKRSEDGKTVSWYNTYSASYQFNAAITYYYIALG